MVNLEDTHKTKLNDVAPQISDSLTNIYHVLDQLRGKSKKIVDNLTLIHKIIPKINFLEYHRFWLNSNEDIEKKSFRRNFK